MPHRRHTRTVSGTRRVTSGLALLAAGSGLILLLGGAAPGVGWSLVVVAMGLGAAVFSAEGHDGSARD
jgi:hypothetical protein